MKKLFLIVIVLVSCSKDLSKEAAEQIMDTDRAMSKTASEIGFNHALLHYAGKDFVKFNDNAYPVIGKEAFGEKIKDKQDITTISWEPVKAEASVAGDIGYSWGNWKFVTPDTTFYGTYFTAWKKTANGTWAMALDGGNSGPAPKE